MQNLSLQSLLKKKNLKKGEIRDLLSLEEREEVEMLFQAAYAVKESFLGRKVYYRAIIEFSNYCVKNCYYCGIRRDYPGFRYEMTEEEMVETGLFAFRSRYGSIVLQSGEREDKFFVRKVEKVVENLKERTEGKLGITLCVGER